MRGWAIILTGLLLTTACKPATEAVTAVAEAPPPAEAPDGGPPAPEPAKVYPVPAGTACEIRGGWSTDTDPKGLNVRAGPSATAAVVGVLPPPGYNAEMERDIRSSFGVVEARDGWVLITGAHGPDEKPLNIPDGWISQRYVGFELQTDRAFVQPDPSSAVVAETWFIEGREQRFRWRGLAECRGEWVRLEVSGKSGGWREGWARGVCDSQETSCDGAAGDSLPAEARPQ